MPRTKKPAGTAVDRRNGRRAADVASPIGGDRNPARPRRPSGLCAEAARQWDLYWESTAANVQVQGDRGVVIRWVDAVDRYFRLMGEADKKPLVVGSTGQEVANPLYAIAEKALKTIEHCEKQLGIGALNRSSLGIAVITERRSLADMNARYGGHDADDPDDLAGEEEPEDPRLSVVPGSVVT
jgi:P27 family predicted phage terminase small subunit